MHKHPSASHVKRASKVLVAVLACYAAYAVGTVVVVTAHEFAHFAGAGILPDQVVFSPSEAQFAAEYAHGTQPRTLVFYLDNFVPVVTGSAFFDPSFYAISPLDVPTVAAAWMGPVDSAHEGAVTIAPAIVATVSAAVAGGLCLLVRRPAMFAFGMAVALGGFYTIHHLIEAGLSYPLAIVVAYLILFLQQVPAGVGFYLWARRRFPVKRRPARVTFRAHARVRGYTVMPSTGGVQFLHERFSATGPPGPCRCGPVGPQASTWKNIPHSTFAKAPATRSTRPTSSPRVPVGSSRSSSAAAAAR